MPLTRDEDISELLANTRTIAMIGASDRPDRPSHRVMAFLQEQPELQLFITATEFSDTLLGRIRDATVFHVEHGCIAS